MNFSLHTLLNKEFLKSQTALKAAIHNKFFFFFEKMSLCGKRNRRAHVFTNFKVDCYLVISRRLFQKTVSSCFGGKNIRIQAKTAACSLGFLANLAVIKLKKNFTNVSCPENDAYLKNELQGCLKESLEHSQD